MIDLSDLVSVTDLSRDLSGYIGKASQEGRRVVILNRNVPTAALVSIADLERLAGKESGDGAGLGGEVLPPVLPGCTRLGTKPGGVVDIPLRSTLMVSGSTGSGKSLALSAALGNANPDPAAPPMHWIVVTEMAAVWMSQELRSRTPISVVANNTVTQFTKDFRDGIAERLSLLRTNQCNTIAEYRAEHPSEEVADFVVVLTDVRISTIERFVGELRELVDPGTFHDIGLYLWTFTQEPPILPLYPRLNEFRREGRLCQLAVGEQSEAASRGLFGSTIAASKRLESGHGYFQVFGDGDGPTPMAVQPPSKIKPWRLEATDTSPFLGIAMAGARTPASAQAMRDYLAGSTIDDAYQQNGMPLPPVGTPVANPVAATALRCGDIAVFKDHYDAVRSSGTVHRDGRSIRLSRVVSEPDFLGFIDPTAIASQSAGQSMSVGPTEPADSSA